MCPCDNIRVKQIKSVLLIALLLFSCNLLCAENKKGVWTGRVGVTAGTNFSNSDKALLTDLPFDQFSNSIGSVNFGLDYKSVKFTFQGYLGAETSYKRTVKESWSGKVNENDSITNFSYDNTQTIKDNGLYKSGVRFIFTPRPSDRIDIIYDQTIKIDTSATAFLGLSINDKFHEKASMESSEFDKITCSPSIEWLHTFGKPGRTFDMKAGWVYARDNRYTLWTIGNTDKLDGDFDIDIYRLTPVYTDSDFSLTALYRDVDLFGVPKLNLDLRLSLKLKQDIDDYSAANLIGEIWEDSTRFRESFHYYAFTNEPEARIRYTTGHFNFDCSFIPQIYSDRLDDSEHTERFDWGRVSPIVKFNTFWDITSTHRLSLNYLRDIKRPDYLQMCWFRRPGSYVNEFQEGNPDLRPSTTNKVTLSYRLRKGKFTGIMELGYTYVNDIIERTFYKETVEDHDLRIYTWINAGYSNTTNTKLTLNWESKSLKATVSGNYNYFVGVNNKGEEKQNGDFSINADIKYDFPWKMTFLAKGRYQSKVIRNYTKRTEYVGVDARIAQRLFKKFDVFIESNDMFDVPIDTLTTSEDGLSGQLVSENLNRYIVKLGMQFAF